ncbi:WXG100 family type VII secretion target [Actinoplanes derwentensis]|uniref:ESAT-6-like protein n=1 Tax=Actinoplanes derwentensis TaxID=113562 RepID=A0A1H1XLW0_9ACTN|nr:WXG100 family type VII secretion target [Actinoplanes derwentensis]GID87740.1 hypothetical protein Ade03nite_66640 [Actinoplanes derwentensis]SDT10192.1 WXG100 family type VII secretion target [Actinoplanes derwentensis]
MTYTFNFAEAQSVIDNIGTTTTAIDTTLSNMETNVETRLAEWTGSARDEYTLAKKAWDKAALDMATHLNTARTALQNIASNYAATEIRNQQNFSDINGSR